MTDIAGVLNGYQVKMLIFWVIVYTLGLRQHLRRGGGIGIYFAIAAIFTVPLAIFNVMAFYQTVYFSAVAISLFVVFFKGGSFADDAYSWKIDPEKRIVFGVKKDAKSKNKYKIN